MPVQGSGGSKKCGDGSRGTWAGDMVLALKGNNTKQTWAYYPAGNVWDERDTIPQVGSTGRRCRVKAGGDIVNADGSIFAMKGNKSREIWRYAPAADDEFVMYTGYPGWPRQAPTDGESPVSEGLEAYDPHWRSDGGALVLSHEDENGWFQIYQVEYSGGVGTETQLTDAEADCEQPNYSSDGEKVCFVVDTAGFYQIAVLDLDAFDREDDANGATTPAAAVGAVSAKTVPRQSTDDVEMTILTSAEYDHTSPAFSPSGSYICYVRESDDGDDDIWRVSADGGSEVQVTSCSNSHADPVWLNNTTIVFTHIPDEDFDQIAKVVTTTGTETAITSSQADHARPDVLEDGLYACFEALDNDGTQIAKAWVNGGSETYLTSGTTDMEAPDWANEGNIFCVRWTDVTSAICWVDATNGGWMAVTDSSAIRDNPDCWYDMNGSTSYIAYERESWDPPELYSDGRRRKWGTGIFRTHYRKPNDGTQGANVFPFALDRVRPSPATDKVMIRWSVPVEADVSLKVFDATGRLVRTLADGRTKPGSYTSVWNGTDPGGRRLATGVYFCTLDNGAKRISRKVVMTE